MSVSVVPPSAPADPGQPEGPPVPQALDALQLADLDAVALWLRGGSVIDWRRLSFRTREEVHAFIRAHELDLEDPRDLARITEVKTAAMAYLRRAHRFPIPAPVAELDLPGMLLQASASGHRQYCVCVILKVMHIIHHLEGRELAFALPMSDQETFALVEEKVYRALGAMLSTGPSILELRGGRKGRDALYSQLLADEATIAANVYDRLRFRIITRSLDDVLPVLVQLQRSVLPFNYVVPGRTRNTLLPLRAHCLAHPRLEQLLFELQHPEAIVDDLDEGDERLISFVADVPVRIPDEILVTAPPSARRLGRIAFVHAELQIVDRESAERDAREHGDGSERDRRRLDAVRIRLGLADPAGRLARRSKVV